MNKRLICILLFALSPLALAAGDPSAGEAKANTCAACHGSNGIASNPTYPNLAGQNQAYLETALKAYRSQERAGGLAALMYPMSGNLSDEDIADLAAWFASLPAEPEE